MNLYTKHRREQFNAARKLMRSAPGMTEQQALRTVKKLHMEASHATQQQQ